MRFFFPIFIGIKLLREIRKAQTDDPYNTTQSATQLRFSENFQLDYIFWMFLIFMYFYGLHLQPAVITKFDFFCSLFELAF